MGGSYDLLLRLPSAETDTALFFGLGIIKGVAGVEGLTGFVVIAVPLMLATPKGMWTDGVLSDAGVR